MPIWKGIPKLRSDVKHGVWQQYKHKLHVLLHQCIRRIFKICLPLKITNEKILKRGITETINNKCLEEDGSWVTHISNNRLTRKKISTKFWPFDEFDCSFCVFEDSSVSPLFCFIQFFKGAIDGYTFCLTAVAEVTCCYGFTQFDVFVVIDHHYPCPTFFPSVTEPSALISISSMETIPFCFNRYRLLGLWHLRECC